MQARADRVVTAGAEPEEGGHPETQSAPSPRAGLDLLSFYLPGEGALPGPPPPSHGYALPPITTL